MTDTEKLQRLFDRLQQIIGEAAGAAVEGGDYFENRFRRHVGYLLHAMTGVDDLSGKARGYVSWSSVAIGADEVKDVFGELYDVGLIEAPLHRTAKQNVGRILSLARRLNVAEPPVVAPATFSPRAANTNAG